MRKSETITRQFMVQVKRENENGITQRELAVKYDLPRRAIQPMTQGKFSLKEHIKQNG
ncbi:MAG: hypothetical protein JJV88_04775 [Sulfurovum sp.]|nr:hypothetical protein [Sulfurovaceae bacterium]